MKIRTYRTKRSIATLVCASLAFTASVAEVNAMPRVASPGEKEDLALNVTQSPESNEIAELTKVLNAIDEIPDSVLLAGDEATQAYLDENASSFLVTSSRSVGDVAKCAGAIGLVVVSTVFPAAKLLRVKKLLKELGGGYEAAKIIVGASTAAEKGAAAEEAAKALLGELSGVTQISDNCPSVL